MKLKTKIIITSVILSGLSACTTIKPFEATSNNGPTTKVGESDCKTYFSLIHTGDCGYETAKASAGITSVHHTDINTKNFFIYSTSKTQVYGN
jgi:hypothetical protein